MDSYEAVHRWRWRALTLWVIIFTVIVFLTLRDTRRALNDLQRTKASVHQLQEANCTLKKFLLTARNTRLDTAKVTKNPNIRKFNIKAAAAYTKLLSAFKNAENCPIPANLLEKNHS